MGFMRIGMLRVLRGVCSDHGPGIPRRRALRVTVYPIGGGQYLDSPNDKYTAYADDMYYDDCLSL